MLTSASYADGMPNASQSWTYDAAGNRLDAGSAFDNLNRPTSLHGQTVTSDDLGNRTSMGSTTYSWDSLNRMTSLTNASGTTSFAYRADGMRVRKENAAGVTLYRHDGQMPVQEVRVSGGATTVIDSAPGARGVEAYSKTQGGSTTVGYPLYDAHGNNVATLTKAGAGWSIAGTLRSYDAWGNATGAGGDPSARYCANLGHRQDDESGLVYMRARYYEPNTGRFISEDPAMDGINWFSYCGGDPVNRVDPDGQSDVSYLQIQLWKGEWAALLTTSSTFKAQAIPFLMFWTAWLGIEAANAPYEISANSQKYAFVADLARMTVGSRGSAYQESVAGKILNFYEGRALLLTITIHLLDLEGSEL